MRAAALRYRRAAVKNGTSCAAPLADLCPVRNACPLETLPKGLYPLAPARVSQSSALRCAPFVQTKELSSLAALRSKPWEIPPPLQLLPPQANFAASTMTFFRDRQRSNRPVLVSSAPIGCRMTRQHQPLVNGLLCQCANKNVSLRGSPPSFAKSWSGPLR
jgi:hypothetical protein